MTPVIPWALVCHSCTTAGEVFSWQLMQSVLFMGTGCLEGVPWAHAMPAASSTRAQASPTVFLIISSLETVHALGNVHAFTAW